MSDDIAIKVENVSKSFKLPHEKTSSIKGAVINFSKKKKGYETQRTLNDISFDVKKGEFFGIVGRNGSGKSTLLKLISEIYTPDSGDIKVNGKLTPFIELGVGFNPELSGRDNVFLNGSLLGFNRKEMEAMYDEIVEFAEIERFMDQKLKNYSSGMQVRLAFSIAIKSNSDILLFDEVLAVGDTDFQVKCFNYFKKIKEDKSKTIVLVTHDMAAVQKFCTRALVLQDGKIMYVGSPNEAAVDYQTLNFPDKSNNLGVNHEKVRISVSKQSASSKNVFKCGSNIEFDISWDESLEGVKNIGVAVVSKDGMYVFGTNTIVDKVSINNELRRITYKLNANLGRGTYVVKCAVFGDTDDDTIYFNETGVSIHINQVEKWGGLTKLEHSWNSEPV